MMRNRNFFQRFKVYNRTATFSFKKGGTDLSRNILSCNNVQLFRIYSKNYSSPQYKKKVLYTLNFSNATHICREFFLKRVSPPNAEALISRYLVSETAQDQEKCLLRHR